MKYLKAFTAKGELSHLMKPGVDKTLCGIRIDRVVHLEPTQDEPGCHRCYSLAEKAER